MTTKVEVKKGFFKGQQGTVASYKPRQSIFSPFNVVGMEALVKLDKQAQPIWFDCKSITEVR